MSPTSPLRQSPQTPELDRQHEVLESGKAQVVQDFYDWLVEQGYVLGKYQTEITETCRGVRPDPLWSESNCDGGFVKRTTRKNGEEIHAGIVCPVCGGSGEVTRSLVESRLMPALVVPEQLMADYFGIDRDKVEAERRAILEYLRSDVQWVD